MRKCDPDRIPTWEVSPTVPDDGVMDSRDILYDQLHSTLLPLLKDHIITLSTLLDPMSMQEESELKLRRVLEIQPEFDGNITQIRSAVDAICPQYLSTMSQTDDQELKQFKVYRLLEIEKQVCVTLDEVYHSFKAISSYMKRMKLLAGGSVNNLDVMWYLHWTERAVAAIGLTIRLLKGSELDVVNECAKDTVFRIKYLLATLLDIVNPNAPLRYALDPPLTHQPIMELGKLAILIVQISRLFFEKFSKHGMNGQTLQLFTQMNSEQLGCICQSGEKVFANHVKIWKLLCSADADFGENPVDSRSFIEAAEDLTQPKSIPQMDNPITSAPAVVLQNKRVCEQAGESLIRKYDSPINLRHEHTSIEELLATLSVDELEESAWKEMLLTRVESNLLPLLERQLTILSSSLNTDKLIEETEPKLKHITLIQKEIETTIDHIHFFIAAVCPEPISAPNRFDDQHLKRLKSYRLHCLKAIFVKTVSDICRVFQAADELLEHLKMKLLEGFEGRLENRFLVSWHNEEAVRLIETAIESIKGSDLDVAQNEWQWELEGTDRMLITEIILPIQCSDTEVTESEANNPQGRTYKLVRQPVIQLAKLAIPLIKMSQLFFNKISTREMNIKRLPSSTEMCSDQIKNPAKSLERVSQAIIALVIRLHRADRADELHSTIPELIQIANNLKSRFKSPLLAVMLYLVPSLPDSIDCFPNQKYYKDWFVTWNTQRILATENFIQFARSIDNHP
ncbi:hypothetical protein PGT21_007003 [Puccinia graminis f. sp. tritici]|uniref:Uncharacterized protein n=1 Tax=Puccinia graminis f. sp. tritici TaxID=56615 RepID=A0A5B0PKK8_PUCGR|nr:hypothetical protein PGT21_007003 [Puccinia graminis f. sp. tritici]